MAITAPPPSTEHASYDPLYFDRLFAIEDRHFWFRARNAVITAVIGRIVGALPDGYRVLEVGCGTGNVLHVLQRTCGRGRVFGMDLFAEGLRFARRRTTCPLIQGDVHTPPFGDPVRCRRTLRCPRASPRRYAGPARPARAAPNGRGAGAHRTGAHGAVELFR